MRFALVVVLSVFWFSTFSQVQDSTAKYIVSAINLQGNKITKDYIITRELEFQIGDTISAENLNYLIERSENNAFNTGLFHIVTILPNIHDSSISFSILVSERWYVWPIPIVENADRNFNTWWENKDFERLSYGLFLDWHNFRGRNENLQITVQGGFEKALEAAYEFPYINKQKTLGLKFSTGYTSNREVNYTSIDNKREFLKVEEFDIQEQFYANARLTVRGKLYARNEITLGYSSTHIADTLQTVSKEYLKNNALRNEYLYLSYLFKFDKRNYIDYPLTGSMFQFYAVKQGFGLLDNEGLNLLELQTTFNNHFHLFKRFYYANGITGMTNVLDLPPYRFQKGMGYGNNFVRGYELYVMDAQHYIFTKNNVKYELIKPGFKKLNFIPFEKFNTISYATYINVFADLGYAFDELYQSQNSLSNKLLLGYGIGLDFVTYYDIVVRTEFSLNTEGDNGLFLHFKKSI